MVTVDNAVLIGLGANETLVNEFPFLRQARQTQTKQGCCGQAPKPTVNMNSIKVELANLPGPAQLRFKELTGWDSVRVVIETSAGTSTVIF